MDGLRLRITNLLLWKASGLAFVGPIGLDRSSNFWFLKSPFACFNLVTVNVSLWWEVTQGEDAVITRVSPQA